MFLGRWWLGMVKRVLWCFIYVQWCRLHLVFCAKKRPKWATGMSSNHREAHGPIFVCMRKGDRVSTQSSVIHFSIFQGPERSQMWGFGFNTHACCLMWSCVFFHQTASRSEQNKTENEIFMQGTSRARTHLMLCPPTRTRDLPAWQGSLHLISDLLLGHSFSCCVPGSQNLGCTWVTRWKVSSSLGSQNQSCVLASWQKLVLVLQKGFLFNHTTPFLN